MSLPIIRLVRLCVPVCVCMAAPMYIYLQNKQKYIMCNDGMTNPSYTKASTIAMKIPVPQIYTLTHHVTIYLDARVRLAQPEID